MLSMTAVAALVSCAGCHSQASQAGATIVTPSADQKAQQTKERRRSEYVASLLEHGPDGSPHLGTGKLTRAAVEAAMGVPDYVWQGDAWGDQSKETVYLYYLVSEAGATASLRDKTLNGVRKRYRFVFYRDGDPDGRDLDELRIYDDTGYGGQQISRFTTMERSYLLW